MYIFCIKSAIEKGSLPCDTYLKFCKRIYWMLHMPTIITVSHCKYFVFLQSLPFYTTWLHYQAMKFWPSFLYFMFFYQGITCKLTLFQYRLSMFSWHSFITKGTDVVRDLIFPSRHHTWFLSVMIIGKCRGHDFLNLVWCSALVTRNSCDFAACVWSSMWGLVDLLINYSGFCLIWRVVLNTVLPVIS